MICFDGNDPVNRYWIHLTISVVVFKRFVLAVKQPGLSSVETVPLHPGWKGLSLFIMRACFVWIFVHREQSGQKASWRCLISCIRLWLFSHGRVLCRPAPTQWGQFFDKVSEQSFDSARCGRDGPWHCPDAWVVRKHATDPQLLHLIRDNCDVWRPCPRRFCLFRGDRDTAPFFIYI